MMSGSNYKNKGMETGDGRNVCQINIKLQKPARRKALPRRGISLVCFLSRRLTALVKASVGQKEE
jgi:hypothetical protein